LYRIPAFGLWIFDAVFGEDRQSVLCAAFDGMGKREHIPARDFYAGIGGDKFSHDYE